MRKSKNPKKVRIGILGGTFDPVHFGHLAIAEKIRDLFDLEIVYFIPTFKSPHKSRPPVANSYDRFAMLALATRQNEDFRILSLELRKKNISYTIDTIRALTRGKRKDIFFFILGSDSFREITAWKDHHHLLRLCHFIVVNRQGYEFSAVREKLPSAIRKIMVEFKEDEANRSKKIKQEIEGGRKHIFYVHIDPVPFSSSEIRHRMKKKKSVRYQVPDAVLGYIRKNELYL
jgi:nicotinate-nucleotide adenylyltransferase